MNKILIATIYGPEAVLASATKLSVNRIYLLIDEKPTEVQQNSAKLIKNSLGKILDVKTYTVKNYDIYESAKRIVELIDMQPTDDDVYVDITSGRKTLALALLYSAYARNHIVKKITYVTEEHTSIIDLPKLSFELLDNQRKILEILMEKDYSTFSDVAAIAGMPRATAYKTLKDLADRDLIDVSKGVTITEAGKISLL